MSSSHSNSGDLRIAVVIPTHWEFRMGGSQYQAKLLVEQLHRTYGASIAYFAARVPDARQYPDHQVIRAGQSGSLRRFGHFWDFFRLQKALQQFSPDIIYQRVSCSYTGISARYSKRSGVPMVWHIASQNDCRDALPLWKSFHRPHAWLEARLARYGANNANAIVAQTQDQVLLLEENFGRRADRLIRNFHPEPGAPTKRTDRLNVVWIANFKPLKRPSLFLEVASHLQDLHHVNFTMIGQVYTPGPLRSQFEEVLCETPNVKCLGSMPQDEVNALLDQAHLLVNTSEWEGFSNTFIQAWMRSVPVLTLGVNPDNLLGDGEIGYCFDSPIEVARGIRELAENPDMLAKMGQRARAFAIKNFSMQNAADLAEYLVKIATEKRDQWATDQWDN